MSNKTAQQSAAWTRPELKKLGKLEDVAPGLNGTGEGSSGKS